MKRNMIFVLSVFVSCLLLELAAAQSNWTKQFPVGGGWNIRDVSMIDSANAWAVGINTTKLMHTRDAGFTWELVDVGSPSGFKQVSFIDSMHGWILGYNPTTDIRRTTNGGGSWTQVWTGGTGIEFNRIAAIGRDTLWVVGYPGLVISTTNGGITWDTLTITGHSSLENVFFLNRRIGWISAIDLLLHTTNGGLTWDSISNKTVSSFQFLDSLNGWGFSWYGMAVRTRDGGRTWNELSSIGQERTVMDMFFADSMSAVCTIWDHPTDPPPGYEFVSIARTTNGGLTWTQQPASDPLLFGVAFAGRNAMAVGGSVLYSKDQGSTWLYRAGIFLKTFTAIEMVDTLQGWAVGSHRTLFHTSDGGLHWLPQLSPELKPLRDVCFIDSLHGWAAGERLGLLRTVDGGKRWQTANTMGFQKLNFFDGGNGQSMDDIQVYKTNDSGFTWWSGTVPFGPGLTDMDFTDSLHGWVVGSFGRVLTTNNGGRTWEQISNIGFGGHFYAVDFVDSLVGWVASYRMFKTSNAGANWVEQTIGVSEYINAIHFVDRQVGWAVGDNGLLLGTTNGGNTWLRLQSPVIMPNPILGIDVVSNHVWIVSNFGQIYYSSNGGGLTDAQKDDSAIPSEFSLQQNYPNPFNPSTTIEFALPKDSHVNLKLYDLLGREVKSLVDESLTAGYHHVTLDGSSLSTGVYFYRMNTGNFITARKLLLVK